jgi:hypothetical protein
MHGTSPHEGPHEGGSHRGGAVPNLPAQPAGSPAITGPIKPSEMV